MSCPPLNVSQSDAFIQIVDINSHTEWQIVQLLKKPTDLDLHCLQKQVISGFSKTRVNVRMTSAKDKTTLNCSFDKEENVRLEEEIKLHHLEQLMHRFQIHRPDDILIQPGTGFFPPKTQPRTPGRMNLAEFKETVSEVLMTDEYDEYLEKLFLKVGVKYLPLDLGRQARAANTIFDLITALCA